ERRRLLRVAFEARRERPVDEQALAVELGEHLAHDAVELLEADLALVAADDPPLRIDEVERRPGAAGGPPPDAEVASVHGPGARPGAGPGTWGSAPRSRRPRWDTCARLSATAERDACS